MTTLNIGKQVFNCQEMANKVQNDIYFLESRIAILLRQPNPNPLVLQTYRQMLECREAILGWLDKAEMEDKGKQAEVLHKRA